MANQPATNTANQPKMCNYTYHHDPFCGHIASFNVEACAAFTCALRNAGDGHPKSCPKPVHNHDLISPYSPSLCYQCELKWVEDVKTKANAVKENTADADKTDFLSLEDLPLEHSNCSGHDNNNKPAYAGTQPPIYDLGTHLNAGAACSGGNNRNRHDSLDSVDPVGHEIANSLFDKFTRVNLEDIPSYAHAPRSEDNTSGVDLDLNEYEYLDLSPVSSLKDEPTDIYDFDLENGQMRDSFTRTFPPLFGFSSPMRRHWRD